jgi:hypothetical protein
LDRPAAAAVRPPIARLKGAVARRPAR